MPTHSRRTLILALATSVAVTLLLLSTKGAAAPVVPAHVAARQAPQVAVTAARPVGPIVAFGDSLTHGYGRGVTFDFFGPPPAHSYPWDLQQLLGVPVVNAGISGDKAYTALHPSTPGFNHRPAELQIPALLALHPSLVLVGFGSAEAFWGVPMATAVADLDALLTALDSVPTLIVGTHIDCTLIRCAHPGTVYTTAWDAQLRILAARHHSGLVTDVLGGLAAAGKMNDGVHPTADGYAVMAIRISVAVRQRLASAS